MRLASFRLAVAPRGISRRMSSRWGQQWVRHGQRTSSRWAGCSGASSRLLGFTGVCLTGVGISAVSNLSASPGSATGTPPPASQPATPQEQIASDGPDPFAETNRDVSESWYETIKTALLSITLAPLRLLLLAPAVLATLLFARLAVIGVPSSSPQATPIPSNWLRSALQRCVRACVRCVLFCLGFHWIQVNGALASRHQAPALAINHVSFLDPLLMYWACGGSFVSKAAVARIPVFGPVLRRMQLIFVDRRDQTSRRAAQREITHRLHHNAECAESDDLYPQLCVFPEATTTNGTALIPFKLGVFRQQDVGLQPVCLEYPHRSFNVAYVGKRHFSPLAFLWRMLTQVDNSAKLTFLPVRTRSAQVSPQEFAEQVRTDMAESMGVPRVTVDARANFNENLHPKHTPTL